MEIRGKEENEIIVNTIFFLEHGKYSERKQYMKDYLTDGVCLNGFIFQKDILSWVIWKPTNIFDNPEYKDDPLVKVISRSTHPDKMKKALEIQGWAYL